MEYLRNVNRKLMKNVKKNQNCKKKNDKKSQKLKGKEIFEINPILSNQSILVQSIDLLKSKIS